MSALTYFFEPSLTTMPPTNNIGLSI